MELRTQANESTELKDTHEIQFPQIAVHARENSRQEAGGSAGNMWLSEDRAWGWNGWLLQLTLPLAFVTTSNIMFLELGE